MTNLQKLNNGERLDAKPDAEFFQMCPHFQDICFLNSVEIKKFEVI